MPELRDLTSHPILLSILCGFGAMIILSLIQRLWIYHRQATFIRKLLWSGALMIPLFGWIFYAGLFHIPEPHDIPVPPHPATL